MSRQSIRIIDEDIIKDQKRFSGIERAMNSIDRKLRSLNKKLLGLSVIRSTDLNSLGKTIDQFGDFQKEIKQKVRKRLSPEEWSK